MTIAELDAERVRPLRRAVLRAGMPMQEVNWPEDDLPGTFHLAVLDGAQVIAVSTWIPRPRDGRPAVQIRGMATAVHRQGEGLGQRLLDAGCARLAGSGIELLWANARDTALAFYARNGFDVIGDGFVDATTQLPHHVVVRHLR